MLHFQALYSAHKYLKTLKSFHFSSTSPLLSSLVVVDPSARNMLHQSISEMHGIQISTFVLLPAHLHFTFSLSLLISSSTYFSQPFLAIWIILSFIFWFAAMISSSSPSEIYSLTTPIATRVWQTPSPRLKNAAELIFFLCPAPIERGSIIDIADKVLIYSTNEQMTEPAAPDETKEQVLSTYIK